MREIDGLWFPPIGMENPFNIFPSIGSITDCNGNYSGDTLQHVVNNCVPISH